MMKILKKEYFFILAVFFVTKMMHGQIITTHSNGLPHTFSKPIPIDANKVTFKESFQLSKYGQFYFKPLILPLKILYSPSEGFRVKATKSISLLNVGFGDLGYTFGGEPKVGTTINGYEIKGGDYVVGLVDRNKRRTRLYKIDGADELDITTIGTTKIKARKGYVEIDITNAAAEEITFTQKGKMSFVNNTDRAQSMKLVVNFWGEEAICTFSIPARSYLMYPSNRLPEFLYGGERAVARMELVYKPCCTDQEQSTKLSLGSSYHISQDSKGHTYMFIQSYR